VYQEINVQQMYALPILKIYVLYLSQRTVISATYGINGFL